MAIYHHTTRMIGRTNGGNPIKALAYITGSQLSDSKTGEIFDFKDKSVEEVHILLPHNAPEWAKDLQNSLIEDKEVALQYLSDMANAAEKRVDGQVYREIEFSLPRELTFEQNKKLATEYVQDQFCGLGMLAIQSFHIERCEETGELNPHCHVFLLTRELTDSGLSLKKNRDWNKREVHEVWREQWAQYANFHLRMHGHDISLDHRSYKDQGLDIEPQVKLGKGVKEQEKRAKIKVNMGDIHLDCRYDLKQDFDLCSFKEVNSKIYPLQEKKRGFIEDTPSTDRGQELRSVRLRNLYRIIRRPEVVLEIASKHHTTFMWSDVQKILGRYVDEVSLFQRLDLKLKQSRELINLKSDEAGKEVYTTRGLLQSEKSLVETAESLTRQKSHGVRESTVVQAIVKANEGLEQFGGLSLDQQKAIYHLSDIGQLKCVVGIAGAGKTTALGICQEIWKAEGYGVYGLAPTGKAAQNLEQSGIPSSTLHRFLKSFEEGRCQYTSNSVLVLDEAGMVDMERFDRLLSAVQQLGVKLIVVGDGAQLQPVEAGPAFRLVTNRLGKAKLNTVLRQKEDWQRDATILFGKQETREAIQTYMDKGHVHIVEERFPSLPDAMVNGNKEGVAPQYVVQLYEVSSRTSSLMYRKMMRDIKKVASLITNPETNRSDHIKQHEDFSRYLEWREIQKATAKSILENGETYHSLLESRSIDPTKMALLFVDKRKDKAVQNEEALSLLKAYGLDSLVGIEAQKRISVDVRQSTKEALVKDWHGDFLNTGDSPKTSLMLAFSNRDVNDLNHSARILLKESGHLSKEEFTYVSSKMGEDEFGKKRTIREEKGFSKGDRIVFTKNDYGLGVKNGSIGTITELNKQSVHVRLDGDEEKEISFAPNLNPHFDHGWAITIHKSQGTTVDKTYLLASFEMTQNLAYVAMTRHREDVQIYGSNLDFWRSEKLPDVLSKSGEKLVATDYLDADSLNKLMKQDDHIITKIFTRLSNELEAIGAVSKRAFWEVADHFLGRKRENEIRISPEAQFSKEREEERAQEILQISSKKPGKGESKDPGAKRLELSETSSLQALNEQKNKLPQTLQDVYEDWKHPAFRCADFYKRVFAEGLKVHGDPTRVEEAAIEYWNEKRGPYMKLYEQKVEQVEKELESPLLSYMSDKSRDLARKAALENPDRALSFLAQVKASKQTEQNAREKADHSLLSTRKQEDDSLQRNAQETVSSYLKFKELHDEQQKSPYDLDLKKELQNLSKYIFKNKEMFGQIEGLDPEISKIIKEKALEKTRNLEYDRGGFSL